MDSENQKNSESLTKFKENDYRNNSTFKVPINSSQNTLRGIASPTRANNMNPYIADLSLQTQNNSLEIVNNEQLNEKISEKAETQEEIVEDSDSSPDTTLKTKLSFLSIKNPYVILVTISILTFVFIIFVFLVIILSEIDVDAKNNSSSSSGSFSTNSSTTESCSQLSGKSLADTLSEKNSSIEAFNEKIKSSIESAGKGTREGVVAAALSITSNLCEEYSVRLPYKWGGGHNSKINLADGSWGANLPSVYYNEAGVAYLYEGLDCSGFVSWAIYNGGYNFPITSSEDFLKYGQTHDMSDSYVAKPGDLVHHSGHIMMIVGVNEDAKTYDVAEAANSKDGVRVRTMKFSGESSNKIIDMSQYYDNKANVGG